MSMPRLKPYSAYRDTGVEWLGEIPAHWSAERLKSVVRLVDLRANGHEGDVPYIGLEHIASGVGRLILQGDQTPEVVDDAAEPSASLFEPGDVLFGKLRPYLAKVWQAEFAGRCSTELLVLRRGDKVHTRYLSYQLLSPGFIGWVDSMTYGTKMPRANSAQVLGTVVAVAPLPEQRAIAAFLDRETARIDGLIAKKERLVELLQEKRTALITRAVTKGLDPTVPMKDSGIEWLGEIPAHWACISLSYVTVSRCDGPFGSRLKSEHYTSGGVRVVRLQNIGEGTFIDEDKVYIDANYARQLGDHGVEQGDVLVAGLGDESHPVGRACVAPDGIEPSIVKADSFRFRPKHGRLDSQFAAFHLTATAMAAAGSLATGATRSRMNLRATAARAIALPPLEEQIAIVDVLRQLVEVDADLQDRVQLAIDRLKELRTALISAAVTGKIDVREEAV